MRPRPRVVAIVPSAGYGRRLGLKIKKPFVSIGDYPLITYVLKVLDSSNVVDAIIIACERSCVDRFKILVRDFAFKKVSDIIVGGKTRFESVRNCVRRVDPSFDVVLIHDAARPFVEKALIEDSIRLAYRYGGCVVAVPESDTVKLVDADSYIIKTLNRGRVYRAQTPQAFKRELIVKAYSSMRHNHNVTDDASLVEKMGHRVKVLKGSYRNIKITTKEDLKIAEALL